MSAVGDPVAMGRQHFTVACNAMSPARAAIARSATLRLARHAPDHIADIVRH